ncbi:hypothetical protein D3C85_1335580 [compost metagenome]
MLAIAFAALLVVQSANQFDLICEGEHVGRWEGTVNRKPFDAHYRIDLDRRVWCGADCTSVQDIASVSPTRIVLKASGPGIFGGHDSGTWVDRSTGRLTGGSDSEFLKTSLSAQCRRATFTPIPRNLF